MEDDDARSIRLPDGRVFLLARRDAVVPLQSTSVVRGLLHDALSQRDNDALRTFARREFGVDDGDDDAVADALAQALTRGTLLLLSRPSRLSAARPEGLRDADDTIRPRDDGGRRPEAPRATTWIEIVCVGLTGVTYAGATLRMRIPGGDRIDVRLDANSSVRIDDLPQGPSCAIELSRSAARTGVMPLDERPRLRGGEPRIRRGGAEVVLATAARHVLVVEGLHGFSC